MAENQAAALSRARDVTTWPVMMRVGNVLELTADACGRAVLMALLVFLPDSHKRARV